MSWKIIEVYKLYQIRSMDYTNAMSMSQLILFLGLISWSSVTVTNGLQCYECLSITCDSQVICESIKVWMNRTIVPKRQHIEFNLNSKCPDIKTPLNSTEWSNLSQECPRSDSVCLEAPIEIITEYNGLKDKYELENHSKMNSKGIIRGCARRRFLYEQLEETIEVKADMLNDTLAIAKETVQSFSQKDGGGEDRYTINLIHSHIIYIDQGTKESVKCLENNCNNSKRPKRNFVSESGRYPSLILILMMSGLILITTKFH